MVQHLIYKHWHLVLFSVSGALRSFFLYHTSELCKLRHVSYSLVVRIPSAWQTAQIAITADVEKWKESLFLNQNWEETLLDRKMGEKINFYKAWAMQNFIWHRPLLKLFLSGKINQILISVDAGLFLWRFKNKITLNLTFKREIAIKVSFICVRINARPKEG